MEQRGPRLAHQKGGGERRCEGDDYESEERAVIRKFTWQPPDGKKMGLEREMTKSVRLDLARLR